MKIKTERLYLRELNIEDARDFFLLNEDPEVIQYTGDGPFDDVKAAEHFLRHYKPYQKYGYGRWAMIRKTDQAFLGWCGLKYSPDLDETDLGFRLYRKYWNQGYATEAAHASLAYGFKKKGLTMIVGRAMKVNGASIRVLEKVGMVYWKEYDFDGRPGVYYRIDKG